MKSSVEVKVIKEITLVLDESELQMLVRDLKALDNIESYTLLNSLDIIQDRLGRLSADELSRVRYPDMTGK